MKKKFLNAFTLAEVMITLTIIGVISAIVVPIAVNSRPDENVMKFKKAHNTLYQVINTLVTSDKYYLNGDLGVYPNGNEILSGFEVNSCNMLGEEKDFKYFCNTFADVVSTKNVNCSAVYTEKNSLVASVVHEENPIEEWHHNIEETKVILDNACKIYAKTVGPEITTNDNIVYFQAAPQSTFGMKSGTDCKRYFISRGTNEEIRYEIFKIFCIDIDGIPDDATKNDCVNECPFGYGIRADGKIMNGKRADEWLEKDIQGES